MSDREAWEKFLPGYKARQAVAATVPAVQQAAAKRRAPVSPAARAIRAGAKAALAKPLEFDDFQRLCMADGLPCPAREHMFHMKRRWRFDYAFIEQRLAVESEGGIHHARAGLTDPAAFAHASADGILRDMEKGNAAILEGWRVLRYTPAQLLSGAVAEIHQALAA